MAMKFIIWNKYFEWNWSEYDPNLMNRNTLKMKSHNVQNCGKLKY